MIARLTLKARRHAIGEILDARFSIRAFEDIRRQNAAYWASPRNDTARGVYREAMREKQRLHMISDVELAAEAAAIRTG